MKHRILTLITVFLLYGSVEILSAGGLFFLKRVRHIEYAPLSTASVLTQDHRDNLQALFAGETDYLVHSPLLGWGIKPDGRWHDMYQANVQGIRATQEYEPRPAPGRVRIAAFGDSFTHGDDVKNEDTWQVQMEKSDPSLEVINFGVGGYGLDQALLRYLHEGISYHPQVVFIGFMEENINRLVNVFRPFYYPGIPLAKPRFILRNDELVLLANPLPELDGYKALLAHPEPYINRLGENDYHFTIRPKAGPLDWSPLVRVVKLTASLMYRSYLHYANKDIYQGGQYDPDSDIFRLCIRLFDEFYRQAEKNGALPVILLFPNRMDLERYRRDATRTYDPLIDHFNARGYRYIDLIAAFERDGQPYPLDDLFGDYHYTPLGHSLVARHILKKKGCWF